MLLRGQRALLVELQARRGTVTPAHRHGHDSYLYVVSGRLRSTMDGDAHALGPGDAVLHPAGAEHAVEALEDAVWVEVKTPAEEPW
jgi:quercetin dioxygenase-like cupin family protein